MNYQIERITLEPTLFLCQRAKIAPDAIAETLAEILPAVFAYATKAGLAFAGPPMSRYLAFGPDHIELEAGLPIQPGPRPADLEASTMSIVELPSGPAASTLHVGPYEDLQHAHGAIETWMKTHQHVSAGAPWESYITDPGEIPNPAEWQTQVVHPIKPQ